MHHPPILCLSIAVTGLTLGETYLQDLLRKFPDCGGLKTCYLLDDAAFIMAVNHPKYNYQVKFRCIL